MDRRVPQAAPYRAIASLCYLVPVAVGVLLLPQFRPIRLLRFHAIQSLLLCGVTVGGMIVLGIVGTVLGPLPRVGMGILLLTGLGISGVLLGGVGVATVAAVVAYDGRTTRLPVLDRWVRRWEKAFDPDPEKTRRKRQDALDRLP